MNGPGKLAACGCTRGADAGHQEEPDGWPVCVHQATARVSILQAKLGRESYSTGLPLSALHLPLLWLLCHLLSSLWNKTTRLTTYVDSLFPAKQG